MTIGKDELLAPPAVLPEEVVELVPGSGRTVRLRALVRAQVLGLRKRGADDGATVEQMTIAAMLVEPELTEAEVARWQDIAPNEEIERVSAAVNRLLGTHREFAKEAVKQFRDEPGT